MIEFGKRLLLFMGILEERPSPEVLELLKATAAAGGELYDPSFDAEVIREARRLGLVEHTDIGAGGCEYLCLTPGGRRAAIKSARIGA